MSGLKTTIIVILFIILIVSIGFVIYFNKPMQDESVKNTLIEASNSQNTTSTTGTVSSSNTTNQTNTSSNTPSQPSQPSKEYNTKFFVAVGGVVFAIIMTIIVEISMD